MNDQQLDALQRNLDALANAADLINAVTRFLQADQTTPEEDQAEAELHALVFRLADGDASIAALLFTLATTLVNTSNNEAVNEFFAGHAAYVQELLGDG